MLSFHQSAYAADGSGDKSRGKGSHFKRKLANFWKWMIHVISLTGRQTNVRGSHVCGRTPAAHTLTDPNASSISYCKLTLSSYSFHVSVSGSGNKHCNCPRLWRRLISTSSTHHASQFQANADPFHFWNPNILALWLPIIYWYLGHEESWANYSDHSKFLDIITPCFFSHSSKRPQVICYNSLQSSTEEWKKCLVHR